MPTIHYPNNPNTDTAFIEQDDGTRNRALMTAPQDISSLELPNNPNSTKGYVTIDGKKQRVVLTADISGSGGGGDQHNLGYYATQAALEEAHPTAEAGDYAIVGATDTVWLWDEDESAWVDSDQKGQVVSVNSKTGTVVLDAIDVKAVPEYNIMPNASADNANQIVLYSGATNGTYTKGYFYQNKVSSTPSSATISQTAGNSLSDLAVDKTTFEQRMGTTTGNYVFTFDGTKWEYDSAEVNLTDYGISYTGTPVADDAITVAYYAQVFLYYWEQINVQPASDPLPSQTGNSGKFLTTDGTDASWSDKPLVNMATGSSSFVIGNSNNSGGNYSTSVGNYATAYNYATSLGSGAWAQNRSLAIGASSGGLSYVSDYTAIGYFAQCYANYAIQLGRGMNSETGTFCVGSYYNNTNVNYKLLDADGTVPADRLPNAINKYSSMPTAASTNEGWIVQYTGATDSTYTHGYIYECVSDGGNPATYSWSAVTVQAGGGGGLPSQTGNSGKFLTTNGTDASWATINALQNVATGTDSISILGPVATANYAINMGLYSGAKQVGCTAIGIAANAGGTTSSDVNASAYGMYSSASKAASIAIGYQASASAAGAAQIGTGTNSTANTLQFKDYPLVSSDGTIPTDRFTTTPSADGTYVPTLTISSGTATRTWGAAASAPVVPATMPTLAVADWSSNTQTVNVTGVTASNIVFVSPAPASAADYAAAGIVCTAQGSGTLTFTCTTVPSNAITVNVVILG